MKNLKHYYKFTRTTTSTTTRARVMIFHSNAMAASKIFRLHSLLEPQPNEMDQDLMAMVALVDHNTMH